MRKHNFSAGPAILYEEVLQEASKNILEFDNIGYSLLEMSHRSPQFTKIMDEAQNLVKELCGLDDRFEVLFLQGGASGQFFMIPMNFLADDAKATYINTGTWAGNAIKEAKMFGKVNVAASSEDKNFNYIPKGYDIPEDSTYFHYTTNNTIFGTQVHSIPETSVPLVADMSSDFMSRDMDFSKFALIYAGAQKNIGPAGTTIVIINKEILKQVDRQIPTILKYQTHIAKGSMFHTPPVFAIYASYLTLKHLKSMGGIAAVEKHNNEKAAMLYDEIDKNPLFEGTAAKEDRSKMNVTFVLKDESLQQAFLDHTKENDIVNIKGHRSVGGFRASIYNAMPKESVQALISAMRTFAEKHG